MSMLNRDPTEEILWSQKYRPQTIEETILPQSIKKQFQSMVDKQQIPNLLLSSRQPGVGKTTVALALCRQLNADVLFINASLENGIGTLRNEIVDFCSSYSLNGSRRVVLLDEADQLRADSMQPALRGVLEEYSQSTSFILTCNYPHKLIEPIRSRLTEIDFTFKQEDRIPLIKEFTLRVFDILNKEGVKYLKKVIVEFVKTSFPDFRNTLNNLQRYSANGEIDEGILIGFKNTNFEQLIEAIAKKDFKQARQWIGETPDIDFSTAYSALYDIMIDRLEGASVPQTIVTLNEYQYKNAFVVSPELNFVACVLELMAVTTFKKGLQ